MTEGPAATGDETADETAAETFACADPITAVSGLLDAHCTTAECHDADAPAAGLTLTGDWPAAVLGQASNLCPGEILAVAGDANASLLWTKVTGAATCGARMPLGGELATAESDCIAAWIDGAAPSSCETCGAGTCVDTSSDAMHCGGCDAPCPAGIACQAGACVCPGDTQVCGGACVNVLASGEHCGGCDQPCDPGLFCLAGACVGDCGALAACGGGCVNTETDPQHCGDCDSPCSAGAECSGGSCACAEPAVSFASDLQPIFTSRCTSMGCHGFPMPQEGLDLRVGASFGDLVDVTSSQCGDRLLVAPGDASSSYLLDKLLGVDLCFGTQMPKDPPTLSPAELDLVSSWICQGALDN
jgi:hypothetical protein